MGTHIIYHKSQVQEVIHTTTTKLYIKQRTNNFCLYLFVILSTCICQKIKSYHPFPNSRTVLLINTHKLPDFIVSWLTKNPNSCLRKYRPKRLKIAPRQTGRCGKSYCCKESGQGTDSGWGVVCHW